MNHPHARIITSIILHMIHNDEETEEEKFRGISQIMFSGELASYKGAALPPAPPVVCTLGLSSMQLEDSKLPGYKRDRSMLISFQPLMVQSDQHYCCVNQKSTNT